jgi:hypothetical protein
MAEPTLTPALQSLITRLGLIEADFANRAEEERRTQLTDAVRRATEQMPPGDRQAFVEQFRRQFPAWGEMVQRNRPESGGASAEQWNDPTALIVQLATIAGKEPARRREVLAKLQASGLVAATLPDPSLHELQKQLQLSQATAIDPLRTVDLLLSLVEFVKRLESFVNGAWNNVARGVGHPPLRPLGEAMARLLSSPMQGPMPAGARQEFDMGLTLLDRRVRVLIAALRASSQQHAAKFAPAEIESMIDAGFLVNKAKACWEKYTELCGGTERETLDSEMRLMQAAIIERIWGTGVG